VTAGVTEGPLTPGQVDAVLSLASAAQAADGVAPLSEQTVLHVRSFSGGLGPGSSGGSGVEADAGSEAGSGPGGPGSGARDWLLTASDGTVAGFAHLDPRDPSGSALGGSSHGPSSHGPSSGGSAPSGSAPSGSPLSGELVVHPAHRRRGHGTALVAALADAAGSRGIRIWAHGDLPASAEFAKATGFTRGRELWQLLLSLAPSAPGLPPPAPPPPALPSPALPDGVTLRTFVPGSDEEAWLAVNRRAFAHHPEQGGWTRADLDAREAEPWFDPDGFFLAVRHSGELVGFHWTKVHPSGGTDGGPIGEVYVVGVDPAAHGGGLGRALTVAGLAYLRERGLAEVMLYVDGDNTPAARLYESLGFTRWHTDVMYER
jgi:mycothiol synthase